MRIGTEKKFCVTSIKENEMNSEFLRQCGKLTLLYRYGSQKTKLWVPVWDTHLRRHSIHTVIAVCSYNEDDTFPGPWNLDGMTAIRFTGLFKASKLVSALVVKCSFLGMVLSTTEWIQLILLVPTVLRNFRLLAGLWIYLCQCC